MRRTKLPMPKGKLMVNYYDRNGAQRWGEVKEKRLGHMIIANIFGEISKVENTKIIEERELPK